MRNDCQCADNCDSWHNPSLARGGLLLLDISTPKIEDGNEVRYKCDA